MFRSGHSTRLIQNYEIINVFTESRLLSSQSTHRFSRHGGFLASPGRIGSINIHQSTMPSNRTSDDIDFVPPTQLQTLSVYSNCILKLTASTTT